MEHAIFPTHTSIFVDEAIEKQILCHYALPRPLSCHFYRQGLNDTYLIRSREEEYYLRIYRHGWRTKREIDAELAFINDMRLADFPFSYPIQRNDGSYLHTIQSAEGTRHAVLFSAARGELCKNPSINQAHSLGRLAAQIHTTADEQQHTYNKFPLDINYLINEPLASIRATFGHLSDEMHLLDLVARHLTVLIDGLTMDADFGVCHGDLHTENVHFDKDDRPTLFDCDCFGFGWRAFDLGTFLWSRYLFEPDVESRNRSWSAFLSGYRAIRPIKSSTLDLVLPFIAMRQIWVMGIHTGQATAHYGRRWLDQKYVSRHFGFLRRLAVEMSLSD